MKNNDFIEIYNNTTPLNLCDDLITWFDLCSNKKFTWHNMPLNDGPEGKKRSLRSDEALSVPCGPVSVSSFALSDKVCDAYWEVLRKCINDYVEKYDLYDIPLSCHQFKIHKVKEGQGYHVWHHENAGDSITGRRMLAWMTYLKVPEEGGETEFLHQSKRVGPVVGRTLIWPAYFTHLHRGNPPLKGEKYYITGWLERD